MFELENWLKEMGLTPEEQKIVAPVFQTRLDKLEQGQLRQSEFSRKLTALDQERNQLKQDYDSKLAVLNTDFTNLRTWEGEVKGLRKKDAEELERLRTRIASTESRMRRLASDNGIPESELGLEGAPVATPPAGAGTPPAIDERYLTREDWQRYYNDIERIPELAFEMADLAGEVRELTGTRINQRELLREVTEANKRLGPGSSPISLRAHVEQKYKLAEERQKLADKKQKEHDDRIVQEAETRLRSEYHLERPNTRSDVARRSPVLEHAAANGRAATQQPDYKPQGTGVSRAVQAYQEGKYSAVQ